MANYNCTIRTNYFRVKDNEAFEEFLTHIVGDDMYILNSKDKKGDKLFGFGCYGSILGYLENPEDDEDGKDFDNAYDNMVEGLMNNVADDDAILIFEAGNERLRYVVGSVLVITSKGFEYKDIADIGIDMAREMLGNKDYTTQVNY